MHPYKLDAPSIYKVNRGCTWLVRLMFGAVGARAAVGLAQGDYATITNADGVNSEMRSAMAYAFMAVCV